MIMDGAGVEGINNTHTVAEVNVLVAVVVVVVGVNKGSKAH